ncbi:nitrous oxide reductase accessory protein NosL [Pendulispora albinea]|uniref:Nitrous oxide reductase accessory protein NosL n=2 Tax=Pendulispora albinea TaxID=2741071 RepID=A0ABZ2LY59_9BACT
MKIANGSLFAAELRADDGQTLRFDALRCALAARLDGRPTATLHVHEYYDGRVREVDDSIVFALGSDVMGPMGSDLVPVAKAQMTKFAADHGAKRFVLLREIDTAILTQIP